jgi:hypothetical protein
MTTNLDLARPVSAQVEIRSINLQEASVKSRIDPRAPVPDEIYLRQAYRASHDVGEGESDIAVYVDLLFEAFPGTAPDEDLDVAEELERTEAALVSLDARYTLVYSVPSGSDFEPDALDAFAELNGTYNVWPYWRELVQTVTGRVGMASVVVPVLKLPVREIDEAEPDDE